MSTKIDLNPLSIDELDALIDEAAALIETKKAEALKAARAEIEKIAASTGMSLEELMGLRSAKPAKKVTSTKKPVLDKYRNPKNHSQTWSGRGKRPKWLQEMLDNGDTLENFLVR